MRRIILWSLIILAGACTDKLDIDAIALEFSGIECRAIQLKDQRYELADRLREIEMDSVHHKHELDSLHNVISIVQTQSLAVADSIKIQMEYLFEHKLTQPEQRVLFHEKLKAILQNKNCTIR